MVTSPQFEHDLHYDDVEIRSDYLPTNGLSSGITLHEPELARIPACEVKQEGKRGAGSLTRCFRGYAEAKVGTPRSVSDLRAVVIERLLASSTYPDGTDIYH